MTGPTFLRLDNIHKRFGAVVANAGVTLDVEQGEIHALLGENGAGKSVAMNILAGVLSPSEGRILIRGEPIRLGSPRDAIRHGIGMVHQHFMLVPNLTVAENYILGQGTPARLIRDMGEVHRRIEALSARYGLDVRPDAIVETLTVGQQQRVEILKALYHGVELLILDEPTAVLTPQETERLLVLMRGLVADGKTIVFISHKLDEVMAVSDRISVMRDARVVDTVRAADTTPRELARKMVGRDVLMELPRRPSHEGRVVLAVEGLTCRDEGGLPAVRDVSFEVRAGEIVGVAGVSGNGQTELSLALAGLLPVDAGRVVLDGRDVTGFSPAEMSRLGVANVPEDRHRMGIVLPFTLAENVILQRSGDPAFSRGGLLRRGAITEATAEILRRFRVKPLDPDAVIGSLSGGNQQKLVVGRELARNPGFMLINQLTRGIDIGAMEIVMQEVLKARDAGAAILLVSTELEELFSVADRILVMCGGELIGEVPPERGRIEEIGLMMGGKRLDAIEPAA
ncbi:simple sugar transport system ATP-binding protein [Amaricoccus macauensis]|uniref:Simple sugar transport system ATP-binding protein n=1 Tax=Amaricoccus macauensis TaxID=57001 RepID=A0A840SRU5_9RHOB|nr:ABC transporter ATP-binding protein [Amaricoccus macauensis]MBB5223844.1 simple sugar transport system ATP-binding protein [Amaricoccus macauensis]